MDREGFRNRMKQYKLAREENPGLKYWEWKSIPKYDEGTDEVRDNTYVAPIEKELVFIPATGATKLFQDIRNKITRNGQIKSGAIDIVSPEFDLLTLGRSIGNAIYKNLPTDMVYRRTTQSEIDDIIESGAFRKLPEGKVAGKGKTFTINGKTVTLHKKGGNAHGGKAFSKGEPWRGTTVTGTADEVIVGIPGKGTQWKVGHHGDYSNHVPFEKIEKGKGLWEPFNERGIIENISPKGMRVFRPFAHGYKEDGLLPITGLNLIGENIDQYADGGEVEEPGLWDKFTNTVGVLYNNAARKIKNFFEEDNRSEVIDLSNQQVTRVTPDTKNLTAIYGNEFIENSADNIRTKRQFQETTDTLIGDKNIPLSNISNFYGIENGKLKAGDLSLFEDETFVIPNRAKKTGKIKKILFHNSEEKQKFSEKQKADVKESLDAIILLANEYGLGFDNKILDDLLFTRVFGNGQKEFNRRTKQGENASDTFVEKWRNARNAFFIARDKRGMGNASIITESNDTIPLFDINIPDRNKTMFADEYGHAMFVNNLYRLNEQLLNDANKLLEQYPMYPILIDNGRYSHYLTEYPDYKTYTSYDFKRDPKNVYIIGTTR